MLGGGRCEVYLPNGTTLLGIIRGNLRKRRSWININDLILISCRDYQPNKCDIIHGYSNIDKHILVKKGEITTEFININNESDSQPDTNLIFLDEETEDVNISTELSDNTVEKNLEQIKDDLCKIEQQKPDNTDFNIDWDCI